MLWSVGRLATVRDRLKRALSPSVGPGRLYEHARTGRLSGRASGPNLLAGAPRSASILASFFVFALGCLWMVRRGRVLAAAFGLVLAMVATIHGLLLIGQGIHGSAALLYPVVILVAAFTLDRRLLVVAALLCLGSAVFLVARERSGALRPVLSAPPGWEQFTDVAIILLLTAVGVHILLADAARGLSALRESERRLAAANRELEARNAELERFTYVVSHDLKSPLVTIRGFLSYVERDVRSGEIDRLEGDLDRIRSATDRMGRLLDDLLELSRTGRIERPHLDVPFEEVVRERARDGGRLSARGVRLEVECPLPVVRGDRQRLVELVQNLLENAAKFMGDHPDPEIRIGVRDSAAAPGHVVLYVRDSGIGIEPAHQARVFELFQRLDPRVEGTGFGLALARRIVETHGGRIGSSRRARAAARRSASACPWPAATLDLRPRAQRGGEEAARRAVSHSSKPSRSFQSVAQESGRAAGSGTVIPSSVTRTPIVSVFTRSREIAR
jgi:signal transduction histidine kinase